MKSPFLPKCRCLLGLVLGLGFDPRAAAGAELVRDAWGIPHLFAERETDGFFGQGWACAEDRRLQMELLRRRGAGRLAEVFGANSVDEDRRARIAGHAAWATVTFDRLPERWRQALRAYAAGVNAWTDENPEIIRRRFGPLEVGPEPWTPTDCLVAARGLLALGSPFDEASVAADRRFREQAARVGEAEAGRQPGMFIDDSSAVVGEADFARDAESYARVKKRERASGFDLRAAGVGEAAEGRRMSHAWAVSGRRSATGSPILESDPQLPLSSPPFFYEYHLAAGAIDARGLGLPGCPGLFIGFNRRIAWGATALGVDSSVTFLERVTADGRGFEFEGRTEAFARRLERIEVKGGAPVIQEVFTNRHGTVFNSVARETRPGEALVGHDGQTLGDASTVRALLEVMVARDWDSFRRAMEFYCYPGLHLVYADVDGHIGYHTAVLRPLPPRSPRRALEGWTGRDEVSGRIPFADLPHVLDPDRGYVSHANNLPVGLWYPYDLGIATGGTGDTGRSLRLRQLLEGERKFSVDDFERVIHRDDFNPVVALLLPVARRVVAEDHVEDPAVTHLLESLEGWDRHAGTTDRFPAARRLENALTPYRGAGLQSLFGAGGGGVVRLAREVGERFTRDGTTPTNVAVRAYLLAWLKSGAGAAGPGRGAGGAAGDEWSARMGQGEGGNGRTIRIPYQRTIPLNLPAVDASLDLVSPPLTCADSGTIWSQPGNLHTQIADLANLDRSRSLTAPGNSEDGRFRTNQMGLWVQGTTHPAPLSRARIEADPSSRQTLTVREYFGPSASALRTVAEVPAGARLVPAIPPAPAPPAPLPGRRPDDPRLEADLRYLLRNERTPAEIDARIASLREYMAANPALKGQLGDALKLGVHLIEEAQAGRLRVPYGSPRALERMRELLRSLPEDASGARRP